MPTPPARRRDAVEKTAAIERAATDLVLEHGYDAVTVDMICEVAGVSPRTFFNHFKTKDAALIGPEPPTIDERAARRFIVSDGPLLFEAAQLIRIQPEHLTADPTLLGRRIRVVGSNPALMARQMERLSTIEGELREIIRLRLRTQHPHAAADEAADAELAEQAELITHLLAGLMRYIGTSWARQVEHGEAPRLDPQRLGALLAAVLAEIG